MQIIIPCDTIARLSHIHQNMRENCDQYFHAYRIEKGCVIVSNRNVVVIEKITNMEFKGKLYFKPSSGLIEACHKDAKFKGNVEITVNEALKYATAKTTFGFIENENCIIWQDQPTDFDKWYDLMKDTALDKTGMGMYWAGEHIISLVDASPSQALVFPANTSTDQVIIIRDALVADWVAGFVPQDFHKHHEPAKLPYWWSEL